MEIRKHLVNLSTAALTYNRFKWQYFCPVQFKHQFTAVDDKAIGIISSIQGIYYDLKMK